MQEAWFYHFEIHNIQPSFGKAKVVQVCTLQQDKQVVAEDVFEILNTANASLCKLKWFWMLVARKIISSGWLWGLLAIGVMDIIW